MRLRTVTLASLVISMLWHTTGCEQLVYVHNAAFGIDVTASTEGTGRMMLGYDAETFALVPRFDNENDNDPPEAMSLVSVSKVEAAGLDKVVFNHFIATGKAADDAAMDEEGLRMMREAVYRKAGAPEEQEGDNP